MAKVREIYVAAKHKLGFRRGFSSYELEIGEFIELEEGDKVRDVREAAIDRLNKIVVDETQNFRDEQDTVENGKRIG